MDAKDLESGEWHPTSPTLWDSWFLFMDKMLLGWLFPQGQLGLWAMQHPVFSPALPIGKAITEVLQCTYMSYYFWGNGMLLYMVLTHFKPGPNRWAYRRTRQLLYGWVAAYCLNFAINFVTPAVSPRLWLQHYYSYIQLEGLSLTSLFQNAVKAGAGSNAYDPKSFGAFPSGHVGLTWLAALSAERLGYTRYARVARVGACLMTMAVLYLRYHYFVDALFASLLTATGLVVGRMTASYKEEDSALYDKISEAGTKGSRGDVGSTESLIDLEQ